MAETEHRRQASFVADNFVQEICSIALTRMLAEAEAGKNTQRILDTLRDLKIDDREEASSRDITLSRENRSTWKNPHTTGGLDLAQGQFVKRSEAKKVCEKPQVKAPAHRQLTRQNAGQRQPKSNETVVIKDQYVTRL